MTVIRAWNRFWFEPEPASTMAVIRIAVGLVVLAWTLSLAPDLHHFYTRTGIVPNQPHFPFFWGILGHWRGTGLVVPLWLLLVVASVCLAAGFHTRLVAVVTWLCFVGFQRRNPWVSNSGDILLQDLTFLVMLMPAGVALSVDRWRKHRHDFWEFPARAPWAVRLVQIQLVIVYAVTVWDKVRGTTWNDGTAVSYALRIADHGRFMAPRLVTNSLVVSNLLTYGTLAIEVSLATLVWHRRTRPWVLGLGLILHLFIEGAVLVGFFTATLYAAYLAWVPGDTMSRWLLRARDRIRPTARSAGPVSARSEPARRRLSVS